MSESIDPLRSDDSLPHSRHSAAATALPGQFDVRIEPDGDSVRVIPVEAQRDGWELALIQGQRAVRRLFEITGTLDRLPFKSGSLNSRFAGPGAPTDL